MNFKQLISSDARFCHGQPCFRINGKLSRVMVYLVLEMLEAGENFQDILKAYPQLSRAHIKAALHYAAQMIKTGEVVPFSQS